MITNLLILPSAYLYKAFISFHLLGIVVLWALFIFLFLHVISQRGKVTKKNKELMKSFDENIKKMSDDSYKDFTEGHIYNK